MASRGGENERRLGLDDGQLAEDQAAVDGAHGAIWWAACGFSPKATGGRRPGGVGLGPVQIGGGLALF
jgi:hypothetical protein